MTEKSQQIKLLVVDVDGVLTDGAIVYGGDDLEIKNFFVRDGQGIALARRARIEVAFVTVRQSKSLSRRAKDLGVVEVHQGMRKKKETVQGIAERYGFKPEEVAYIGDDLVDLPVMKWVGFPVAVADAVEEVKEVAIYVTKAPGGRGVVREVVELILKAKGVWENLLKSYYEELQ